jgi:ribosomal protein S19
MVWVNGQFLSIETAYKQNLITKNMVETIANIHNGTKGNPIKVS